MNIFEQLSDIISTKNNKLIDDAEDEKEFVPFLTQRWLSMYSPAFAEIMNISANRFWKTMEDKQMWYKYFIAMIPKSHVKRIRYFKKIKKTNKSLDKELIDALAMRYELSKREIRMYIEQGSLDIKQVKKEMNIS